MKLALATTNHDLGAHDYEPVSLDSETVRRRWAAERNFLRQSASDWMPTVRAAFEAIRRSDGVANWDGEGAKPITARTLVIAESVIEALFGILPNGTPVPDIVPEADGEVCLSWSADGGRIFSLSLGEHGNANYAGQFGKEGGVHGWQPLATNSRLGLERSLGEIAEHVEKLYRAAARHRSA